MTHHLDLPSVSCSVCQIQASQLAVSTMNHTIQFVSVGNGGMTIEKSLQFDQAFNNIACHNGKLYASTGLALNVYTMYGQFVKTLYECQSPDDEIALNLTKFAISDDGDRIYVANFKRNTLTTLDVLRRQLATFTDSDLKGPYDVCVAGNGTVLVCGYSSHNVIQVDKHGQQKLAIVATHMDKIYGPSSILFDRTKSELVVGGLNDEILVLNLFTNL